MPFSVLAKNGFKPTHLISRRLSGRVLKIQSDEMCKEMFVLLLFFELMNFLPGFVVLFKKIRVVIKLVDCNYKACRDEAQIMINLNHENIVKCINAFSFRAEGKQYTAMFMEYCEVISSLFFF